MQTIITFITASLLFAVAVRPSAAASEGTLTVSDWPIRAEERVEIEELRIEWRLSVRDDVPFLAISGLWTPGDVVTIDGVARTVCDEARVAPLGSDECHKSEFNMPIYARFSAVGVVATENVYFALLELPLPQSWDPNKSFQIEISRPWDRLFSNGLAGEAGPRYFSEEDARSMIEAGVMLERLMFTEAEFVSPSR